MVEQYVTYAMASQRDTHHVRHRNLCESFEREISYEGNHRDDGEANAIVNCPLQFASVSKRNEQS